MARGGISDVRRADVYGRQRAAVLAMMGIVLLLRAVLTLRAGAGHDAQTAFGVPAWSLHIVIAVMAAVLIATGGGLLRPARVLALANDETARANRRAAMTIGFWVVLAIALAGYAASFWPAAPSMRTLARLTIDGGEAAALLAFAALEIAGLRRG